MSPKESSQIVAVAEPRQIQPTISDFSHLISSFLQSQDVRESSKRTYERGLRPFMDWIGQSGIQRPTRQDILAYKAFIAARGLSALTVSAYLVVVRKFFEWAETMKLYPNVAKGIKGAKRSRGFKKDPLTVDQVSRLLSGIRQSDSSDVLWKRDFALVNLLIRTGLRTIEAVRTNIGDIRQSGGEALLWIQGKGRDSKDEFALLTPESLNPLNEYLALRSKAEDTEPLFASDSDRNHGQRLTTRMVSGIVKYYLRKIGLDSHRLTAHSLRHTAITLSLQGGATIQEAQALGRHSDINTTLTYAHNIDRIARAPERKIDKAISQHLDNDGS